MREEGFQTLAEQNADPVAAPDAGGGEDVREPVGAPPQITKSMPANLARAPLLDQGEPVVRSRVAITDRIRDVEPLRDLPVKALAQGREVVSRLQHASELSAGGPPRCRGRRPPLLAPGDRV